MSQKMQDARTLAEQELGEAVEREETLYSGECEISTWTPKISWPKFCIAICQNGVETYVVSNGHPAVQRFLKDARPNRNEVDKMVELLEHVLPMSQHLLTSESSDSIRKETGYRDLPHFDGSSFVCHCNDFSCGKVLRLEIDSEYELTSQVVGEGVQMDLL